MSQLPSILEGLDERPGAQRTRARRPRWALPAAAALAISGWAIGGVIAFPALLPRVERVPDDPFNGDLAFAILDDDFNRLPVRERLELLLELADRLRAMSSGDSAALASFAAGLTAAMRERIEANLRIFGVDFMSDYGSRYVRVPEAERERFLDEAALEWSKLADRALGREREISDDARLAEMRRQAREDTEAGRGGGRLTVERASDFMRQVQSDINQFASPNDRASTSRFLRDMTRRLRGRDVETNRPAR